MTCGNRHVHCVPSFHFDVHVTYKRCVEFYAAPSATVHPRWVRGEAVPTSAVVEDQRLRNVIVRKLVNPTLETEAKRYSIKCSAGSKMTGDLVLFTFS